MASISSASRLGLPVQQRGKVAAAFTGAPSAVRPCIAASRAAFVPFSPATTQRRASSTIVRASGQDDKVKYNTEFGYSRKDVILIGCGLIAAGYGMYYGLQATGMEPGYAGNWVQLVMIMGLCVGWVSTYIFRVATKQMTYVKQLEQYEEAVMRKRVEEMTSSELEEMMREAEAERAANAQKKN